MIRVALLAFFFASGFQNFANAFEHASDVSSLRKAAAHASDVISLGRVRNIVNVLQGISERIGSEQKEENALYQDITQFCKARQRRGAASTAVVSQLEPLQTTESIPDGSADAGLVVRQQMRQQRQQVLAESPAALSPEDFLTDAEKALSPMTDAPAGSADSTTESTADSASDETSDSTLDSQTDAMADDAMTSDSTSMTEGMTDSVADDSMTASAPDSMAGSDEVQEDEDVGPVADIAANPLAKAVADVATDPVADVTADPVVATPVAEGAGVLEVVADPVAEVADVDEAAANANRVAREIKPRQQQVEKQLPVAQGVANQKLAVPFAEGVTDAARSLSLQVAMQRALDDLATASGSLKVAQALPDRSSLADADKELQEIRAMLASGNVDRIPAGRKVHGDPQEARVPASPKNVESQIAQVKAAQRALEDLATASSEGGSQKVLQALPDRSSLADADKELQEMQAMLASGIDDRSAASKEFKAAPRDASVPQSPTNLQPHRAQVELGRQKLTHVRVKPAQHKAMIVHRKKAQPQMVTPKLTSRANAEGHEGTYSQEAVTGSDDVEQGPKKMADILSVNDGIIHSEYNDVEVTSASHRKPQPQKPVAVRVRPEQKAAAQRLQHSQRIPSRRMPVRLPKGELLPPKVVSQYPLLHNVARVDANMGAPQAAGMRAHQVASKQQVSAKKQMAPLMKRPPQLPKISAETPQGRSSTEEASKNLARMSIDLAHKFDAEASRDVRSLAPSNEMTPAMLDAEIMIKQMKRDKDAHSVDSESAALDNVIGNEEAQLDSAVETSQMAPEAQLKRQLKAYAESGEPKEQLTTDDQSIDSGFVDFDKKARSAVSVGGNVDNGYRTSSPPKAATDNHANVKDDDSIIADSEALEKDMEQAEKELMPMRHAPDRPPDRPQSQRAVVPTPVAMPELLQKDDLSLASQALDDLWNGPSGAIPNIEKEALQLSPSFLQISQGKQHQRHTPGIPSEADLDKAWYVLRRVAKQTRSAMSLAHQFKKAVMPGAAKSLSVVGLVQNGGINEHDVDEECGWLMNNFQHRQHERADESDMLMEANQLLGDVHVYLQLHSHETRQLRGGR